MRLSKAIVMLLITFITISCSEVKTSDPIETYKYWSGTIPPDEIKVLNGKYWQSAHFTKEYIMYLKLNSTEKWWSDFIKENNLIIDSNVWTKSTDSPEWFRQTESTIRYRYESDFDQGSRYMRDSITGECCIYEIQL